MTPITYRKKPVEIEAMQLTGTPAEMHAVYQWVEANTQGSFDPDADEVPASGVSIDPATGFFLIATLEGVMSAKPGDYIIRGVQGEFYPCKADIFEATYEMPVHVSDENRRIIASAYDDGDGHNVTLVPTDDHPWFAGVYEDQEVYLGLEHEGTLYSVVFASSGACSVIVGRGLVENEMGVVFSDEPAAKAYVKGLTAK